MCGDVTLVAARSKGLAAMLGLLLGIGGRRDVAGVVDVAADGEGDNCGCDCDDVEGEDEGGVTAA